MKDYPLRVGDFVIVMGMHGIVVEIKANSAYPYNVYCWDPMVRHVIKGWFPRWQISHEELPKPKPEFMLAA